MDKRWDHSFACPFLSAILSLMLCSMPSPLSVIIIRVIFSHVLFLMIFLWNWRTGGWCWESWNAQQYCAALEVRGGCQVLQRAAFDILQKKRGKKGKMISKLRAGNFRPLFAFLGGSLYQFWALSIHFCPFGPAVNCFLPLLGHYWPFQAFWVSFWIQRFFLSCPGILTILQKMLFFLQNSSKSYPITHC